MISDWVKPPEIISALIASFGGRETRSERYNVLVLHKSYKLLCDSREQFFKNYIPGSQKFTSLIHQNVHLNLLRCRCKNSKRFLNFRPPQFPHLFSVRWNTSVAWQRLHVMFFRAKRNSMHVVLTTKFHLQSEEVLCSPEILSGGFTQSLIILVDIECIDYSWIFDCRVSRFLKNRARESRFL